MRRMEGGVEVFPLSDGSDGPRTVQESRSLLRQALEGALLAQSNRTMLNKLTNVARITAVPRDSLPHDLLAYEPERGFDLDHEKFLKNLRSARRGAAGGPSGMTTKHLRPLLDDDQRRRLLVTLGEQFARAQIPDVAVRMVRLGLLTALSKPDGGVRGIFASDVIRRLVGRTKAQQLSQPVEAATAPHQYGFSTKAGCECAAHILQGLTEMNPEATVTSIDGVSAYDFISMESMLTGLRFVVGDNAVLPFVRLFYGRPSVYLWEDDLGTVHRIPQGEGGEQGGRLHAPTVRGGATSGFGSSAEAAPAG